MPNQGDEEREELRTLIWNIFTNSAKEWGKIERNGEMAYIQKKEELAANFPACNSGILKDSTNDERFKLKRRVRIFLPPLEGDHEFLPLLTFKWDFSARNEESGFFLDLAKDGSQILSLRFERGNGDGGGDHDYLHMQINNRIDDRDGTYVLSWLPKHHPHVLLRTKRYPNSPIILLLYLLGSLYGFQGFTQNVLSGVPPKYEKEMKFFLPN